MKKSMKIIIVIAIIIILAIGTTILGNPKYPEYRGDARPEQLTTSGELYDTIKMGYSDFDLKTSKNGEGLATAIVYCKIERSNAMEECDKFVTRNAIITEIYKERLKKEAITNIEFELVTDNKMRGSIKFELKNGDYVVTDRSMKDEYEKAITSL